MPTTKISSATLILIIIIGIFILAFPISLPMGAGDGDFRAYWSSTYLLAHGRDFSDAVQIGNIERDLANWDKSETVYAWFSPIGNLVLLPYTFLPFQRATYYWLLTNVIILFSSIILIWGKDTKRLWIPLLTVFGFSMTIVSLVFGQINTLEILGLALFLSLHKSKQNYTAGASLVLTIIKPHLVILTLPLLMLDLLRQKQWKTLVGFAVTLLLCMITLFAINTAWLASFWHVITSGMSTVRQTPTLNGLLVILGEPYLGKLIWITALLLAGAYWFLRGKSWDRRTMLDISVTVGLIASPIGWSYDQIMLIFPLLSILSWISNSFLVKKDSIIIVAILVIANIITYYERTFSPSDIWFFWVPMLVMGIYLFAWQRKRTD